MERYITFDEIETAIGTKSIEEIVKNINFTTCLDTVKEFWEDTIYTGTFQRFRLKDEKLTSHFFAVSKIITKETDLLYYMCMWYDGMSDRRKMSTDSDIDVENFYTGVYHATNESFRVIYNKVIQKIDAEKVDKIIKNTIGYLPGFCVSAHNKPTNATPFITPPPAPFENIDLPAFLLETDISTGQENNQETTTNTKGEEYSYINKEDATKLGLYKVLLGDYEEAKIITKREDGRYKWNKQKNQFVLFCALLQENELLKNNQEIQWVEILQDFSCDFVTTDLSTTRTRLHTMSDNTLHEIDSIFLKYDLKTKNFRLEKRKEGK